MTMRTGDFTCPFFVALPINNWSGGSILIYANNEAKSMLHAILVIVAITSKIREAYFISLYKYNGSVLSQSHINNI